MATGGGAGWLVETIGGGRRGNTRLGQAFVLFGLLSVVGGLGLFALTETFRFDPDAVRTYRGVAVGMAGYGLPAFLLGLVVVSGGGKPEIKVALVGGLLSTVGAFLLLTARFGPWEVLASPVYVVVALAVYALGASVGSVGAAGAMLLGTESDERDDRTGIETEAESEFVWGEPPEE